MHTRWNFSTCEYFVWYFCWILRRCLITMILIHYDGIHASWWWQMMMLLMLNICIDWWNNNSESTTHPRASKMHSMPFDVHFFISSHSVCLFREVMTWWINHSKYGSLFLFFYYFFLKENRVLPVILINRHLFEFCNSFQDISLSVLCYEQM